MNREAMREGEILARRDRLGNFARVNVGRELVGYEHHHQICFGGGPGDRQHFQTGVLGFFPRCASGTQTNCHITARVFEIIRLRKTLAAVTNDGDLLVA
jgi:hypothetical protein